MDDDSRHLLGKNVERLEYGDVRPVPFSTIVRKVTRAASIERSMRSSLFISSSEENNGQEQGAASVFPKLRSAQLFDKEYHI